MMRILYVIITMLMAAGLFSCGPSEEEQARAMTARAQQALAKGDSLAAVRMLDSIPRLYPNAAYAANAAKNLAEELLFDMLHRKEAHLDSLQLQIAGLERPFLKEKSEFDRYTQYVHRRQNFERSWDRSFIRVHLDERGDIYLSSNYHGEEWLNHTSLRVYDSGDDARTEEVPVGDPDNHRSDFMDAKWEKVSYRNGKDNGVMEFIADNTGRNLKAVFLGDRHQYIILEDYDKQAVKEALLLSAALKKKMALAGEVASLKKRLGV